MEPSTRAFKRFRGSFRVPYPFFVELVERVKQRDWFPTGQEDAVGRPCIPVELKVSRTDCHDSYLFVFLGFEAIAAFRSVALSLL